MILTRLPIRSTLLSRMAATFSSRPISLRFFSCSTGTSRYRKTDWRAITRRSVTLDSWKMTSDVRPSLKLAFSLLSLKFSNGSTATDLVLAAGETDFGRNQYRAPVAAASRRATTAMRPFLARHCDPFRSASAVERLRLPAWSAPCRSTVNVRNRAWSSAGLCGRFAGSFYNSLSSRTTKDCGTPLSCSTGKAAC